MINKTFDKTGRVVFSFDTVAKTVFENGATRPMTPEESAQADALNSQEAAGSNELKLLTQLEVSLASLRASLGSTTDSFASARTLRGVKNEANSAINASPAAYLKAVNQAVIEVNQAVTKLVRTQLKAFDGTE